MAYPREKWKTPRPNGRPAGRPRGKYPRMIRGFLKTPQEKQI